MRKYLLLTVALAGFVGVVWGDIAPPLPKPPPIPKPTTQPTTTTSAPATTPAPAKG